jgi:hypothetical protein
VAVCLASPKLQFSRTYDVATQAKMLRRGESSCASWGDRGEDRRRL